MNADRAQALAGRSTTASLTPPGRRRSTTFGGFAGGPRRRSRRGLASRGARAHLDLGTGAVVEGAIARRATRAQAPHPRHDHRSTTRYLAHAETIARASGAGGNTARSVKRADLADRALNPPIRSAGRSPPYALALDILQPLPTGRRRPGRSMPPRPRRREPRSECRTPRAGGASSRPADGRAEPTTSGGARPLAAPGDDRTCRAPNPARAQQLGLGISTGRRAAPALPSRPAYAQVASEAPGQAPLPTRVRERRECLRSSLLGLSQLRLGPRPPEPNRMLARASPLRRPPPASPGVGSEPGRRDQVVRPLLVRRHSLLLHRQFLLRSRSQPAPARDASDRDRSASASADSREALDSRAWAVLARVSALSIQKHGLSLLRLLLS